MEKSRGSLHVKITGQGQGHLSEGSRSLRKTVGYSVADSEISSLLASFSSVFYTRFLTNLTCSYYAQNRGYRPSVDQLYAVAVLNFLDSKGNYSDTSNNTKLVHWPLMGGLLHLVQREGHGRLRSRSVPSSLYQEAFERIRGVFATMRYIN